MIRNIVLNETRKRSNSSVISKEEEGALVLPSQLQ